MAAKWYFGKDGKAHGPVSETDLLAMLQQDQLQVSDLVFLEGDDRWRTVAEMWEMKKLGSVTADTATNLSFTQVQEKVTWVVLKKGGDEGAAHLQLGPYTTAELNTFLASGQVSYSDYVWRPGFAKWKRIGGLDEFDRRGEFRDENTMAGVPTPDVAATVASEPSEVDLSEVTRSGVMQQVAQLQPTKAEDPAPEGTDGDDLLSQKTMVFASGNTVTAVPAPSFDEKTVVMAPLHPTQPVTESTKQSDEEEISAIRVWKELLNTKLREAQPHLLKAAVGVVAAIIVLAVVLKFRSDDSGVQQVVQSSEVTPSVPAAAVDAVEEVPPPAAPVETAGANSPAAATARANAQGSDLVADRADRAEPPPETAKYEVAPAGRLSRFQLKQIVSGGQPPVVVFQTDAPIGERITLNVTGRTGEILELTSLQRQYFLVREYGKPVAIDLRKVKMPSGAYHLQATAGTFQVEQSFFNGRNGPEFQRQLETHNKRIAWQQQMERKAVFHAARHLEKLAGELGSRYVSSRQNPNEWRSYYARFRADLRKTDASFRTSIGSAPKGLAYPEAVGALRSAMSRLNDQSLILDQAVQQKRAVAGNPKGGLAIVKEFQRIKSMAANLRSRR